MTKHPIRIGVLSCLISGVMTFTCLADQFESQFEIVKAMGDCGVKAPSAKSFKEAADGSKHDFGTVVKTGRKASAIIRFSQFNGCRIFARSTVAITEQMRNKRLKLLKLDQPGKVQIKLDPSFREHNDLKVETPSAVCGAIGCNFVVEYQIIADLRTTIISCTEGEVAIAGSCFHVSGVKAGGQVTVAKTPDGNFIRIKQVSGSGVIKVLDEDGTDREVTLEAGDEVRIMAEPSTVDQDELMLIYEIRYIDPTVDTETWRVIVDDEDPVLPRPWPSIIVTTPEPAEPTPTPVGKRGDEGMTGDNG